MTRTVILMATSSGSTVSLRAIPAKKITYRFFCGPFTEQVIIAGYCFFHLGTILDQVINYWNRFFFVDTASGGGHARVQYQTIAPESLLVPLVLSSNLCRADIMRRFLVPVVGDGVGAAVRGTARRCSSRP